MYEGFIGLAGSEEEESQSPSVELSEEMVKTRAHPMKTGRLAPPFPPFSCFLVCADSSLLEYRNATLKK